MKNSLEARKSQLKELAETVNLFKSEAVQLRVIDMLLALLSSDTQQKPAEGAHTGTRKKPGSTKAVQLLLDTDYFATPRKILEIATHCNKVYGVELKTSDLSGVLLKQFREKGLDRRRAEIGKGFEYLAITEQSPA
ncbi:MAG: hypothetical protein V4478_01215 [Patescibacteria group bacterium]